MVIQCELCTATGQTAEELLRHYSTHFAPGSCKQCHKQLVLIDGQCYVLQLHNQGTCKHRHLLDPFVLDEFSDFGVIKTEIVSDDEPCETANNYQEEKNPSPEHYHAVETVEVQPFELIQCDEIKIELEDKQEIASRALTISSKTSTNQMSNAIRKTGVIGELSDRHTSTRASSDSHENLMRILKTPKIKLLAKPTGEKILGKHKCSVCHKFLHSESLLRCHMRALHRSITTKITSKAEIDQIPPEQLYTDAFGDKHLREFPCEYCGRYFMYSSSLRSHLNRNHLPTKHNMSLTEEECKKYPPEQILIKPNGQRFLRKFPCNICNKYLVSQTGLREHKKTHEKITKTIVTGDEIVRLPPDQVSVSSTGVVYARKHKCSECNRYYLTKQMLQAHMRYHKRATTAKVLTEEECKNLPANRIITLRGQKLLREVKCEHCDRYMLTKKTLKDHIREVHEQKKKRSEKPQILTEEESKQYPAGQVFLSCSGVRYLRKFQCDICKRYISTRDAVVSHMRNSHVLKKVAKPDEKYPCDICGKELRSERSLKHHKWSHSQTARFICTFCGKGFTNKPALEEHNNVHMGLKPFKCGECEKAFSKRVNLSVHQRVHTGFKPFKCHVAGCDRAYAHCNDLNRHLYGAHRIYKRKHECHICSRIFHAKKLLTKHMLSHD